MAILKSKSIGEMMDEFMAHPPTKENPENGIKIAKISKNAAKIFECLLNQKNPPPEALKETAELCAIPYGDLVELEPGDDTEINFHRKRDKKTD